MRPDSRLAAPRQTRYRESPVSDGRLRHVSSSFIFCRSLGRCAGRQLPFTTCAFPISSQKPVPCATGLSCGWRAPRPACITTNHEDERRLLQPCPSALFDSAGQQHQKRRPPLNSPGSAPTSASENLGASRSIHSSSAILASSKPSKALHFLIDALARHPPRLALDVRLAFIGGRSNTVDGGADQQLPARTWTERIR